VLVEVLKETFVVAQAVEVFFRREQLTVNSRAGKGGED
jgi:hypothetical protein